MTICCGFVALSTARRKAVRRFLRDSLIIYLALAMLMPGKLLFACTPPNPPSPPPTPCPPSADGNDNRCEDNTGPGGCTGAPPGASGQPVYLYYGRATESVSDLRLAGPAFNWALTRSYSSGINGDTAVGNKWHLAPVDMYAVFEGLDTVALIRSANTKITFTRIGTTYTYTTTDDNSLALEAVIAGYDVNSNPIVNEIIVTDRTTNQRWVFYGPSEATNLRGRLKESTTNQWAALGWAGFEYPSAGYDSTGRPTIINTPQGQDYTINFTYSGTHATKVEIKQDTTVLQMVEYKYYGDVTSPSADIGTSGDLVQVKVSIRATADTTTPTIVRYTQYRYDANSRLKAVYEHDAIQRIMSKLSLGSPEAIMSQNDTGTTPPVRDFANRSFEYYSSNASTSSVTTTFTSENLNTLYGGADCDETGFVMSETIRGSCATCGTTTSNATIKKNYYYEDIAQGDTIDQNEVVRLVIEDTVGGDNVGKYRTVYGFNDQARELRKVFVQDPVGTPAYWAESTVMATTGLKYHVGEERKPSAHTISSASDLRKFLDPFDSEAPSWQNDTDTLRTNAGQILVHSYNAKGMRTDTKIKQGTGGTAYYIGAWDYGDGDGDAAGRDNDDQSLLVGEYYYPTATTTRADGNKTSYIYTFWDSPSPNVDLIIKTKWKISPIIAGGQNGPGIAAAYKEYYDRLGLLRWTEDGERYINYYSYNPATGGTAYVAIDVDPASVSGDISSGSIGNWYAWTIGDANSNAPSRDGSLPSVLQLATKIYFDANGQSVRKIDPSGANHYVAYSNSQRVEFPYWNSGTSTTRQPIRVEQRSNGVDVSDTFDVKAGYGSISTSSGSPTGFSTPPGQSDYVAWTHNTYDDITGRLTYSDRYFDIPTSGSGTLSTNFYRTAKQYDALGRVEYTIQVAKGSSSTDRVEQVTRTIYDLRDRLTEVQMGVSGDSAANSHNMTDSYNAYPTLASVKKFEYDGGGVGDGFRTKAKGYFGTGTNDFTGQNLYYDFRGRLRGIEPFYMNGSTETAIGPFPVQDVDWAGNVLATAKFDTNLTWSSVQSDDDYAATITTNRRTLEKSYFDDLGRLYRAERYKIASGSGSGSDKFVSDIYRDRLDRVVAIKQANAAATEVAYDGAGRQYQTRVVTSLASTLYSSGRFQYRAPAPKPTRSSMSGGDDLVIQLTHLAFDTSGNVTEEHRYENTHADEQSASRGIDLSATDDYVRQSVYSWYDAADRLVAEADTGSGDTTAGAGAWKYAAVPTRSGTAPTASTSTQLVTLYAYNADSGLPELVTDPAGFKTKTFYDRLSRKTYAAKNFSDFAGSAETGTGDSTDKSKDTVTKYTYNGLDQIASLVAMDQNGDGSLTDNQTTTYLFESPVSAAWATNEIYPDSSDTASSGTDQVKKQYAVDGILTQMTDQRAVVLQFTYNGRRQLQLNAATTIPFGYDTTIKSIKTEYDNLGRREKITSYANSDGTGTIHNQLQWEYNDLDQVVTSYQSHQLAVATGGMTPSPKVQYVYDATAASNVFSYRHRLEQVIYPAGRTVFYDYDKSNADYPANRLSRVNAIRDTNSMGNVWASYRYNGANRFVKNYYDQAQYGLDLSQGTANVYAGLDRFGRIVDAYWAGTTDVDRIKYGYDSNGNRTFRDISSAIYSGNDKDQVFAYDGQNRLTSFDEGTANSAGDTITSSPKEVEQDWTLDVLGNWTGLVTKANGTTDLDQSRTFNKANELTGTTETTGSAWTNSIAYGGSGVMIGGPLPTDPTKILLTLTDAWNRPVAFHKHDGLALTQLADYEYDGLNRRIVKGVYSSGTLNHRKHYYLNEDWQTLEVRKETGGTEDPDPLEQMVWHPYYVDALATRFYDSDTDPMTTNVQHYFSHDANFNVIAATDASGAAVERYHYTPYGELKVLDANFAADSDGKSDVELAHTYTGREFDLETGLYYYRNRYYHAQLGSFISRDPIGYAGSDANLYKYALSNPTGFFDPFGEAAAGLAGAFATACACAGADGPFPIGDAVGIGIIVVVGSQVIWNYCTSGDDDSAEDALQQQIDEVENLVDLVQEEIEAKLAAQNGYGQNDVSGSEQYLQELLKELADLKARQISGQGLQ